MRVMHTSASTVRRNELADLIIVYNYGLVLFFLGNSLIVLSGDDGHSRLKGVATSLCRETVSGRMHPNSIDASRINEMLG